MITPIQSTNYQSYSKNNNPKFSGRFLGSIEKSSRNVEFIGRKLINLSSDVFESSTEKLIKERVNSADIKSPDYIREIVNVGKFFSPKNEIEINIHDERIKKIAQSGKPHIFIMNHDSQNKDPEMLGVFNTILYSEYLKTGQASTCPRPKIILNEDILLAMNTEKRNVFLKIGAVPIDASLTNPDTKSNAKQFIPLMRSFINGEANIFIFPEGKNAGTRGNLENRFQLGTAEIVTKLADKVPEVNVTPIGFAYNKWFQKKASSMYIGKTVTFKKEGDYISAGIGNITSEFADEGYKNFFNGRNSAILTDKGIPLPQRECPAFVGGVLCENLKICTQEAKNRLKHPIDNDFFEF